MTFAELFLQRHAVLYDFYLEGMWEVVSEAQMRSRPHPRVNSIAWNLWHIARAEDSGVNRFVSDRPQVLDDGDWISRLGVPWRHHGSGMTFAEVDELDARIDLPALRAYASAIAERTREVIASVLVEDLNECLTEDRVRAVVVGEGLAHGDPEGLVKNYTGWSKGKCLMNLALTHPYQHVGEMGVIASLLGVEFD